MLDGRPLSQNLAFECICLPRSSFLSSTSTAGRLRMALDMGPRLILVP